MGDPERATAYVLHLLKSSYRDAPDPERRIKPLGELLGSLRVKNVIGATVPIWRPRISRHGGLSPRAINAEQIAYNLSTHAIRPLFFAYTFLGTQRESFRPKVLPIRACEVTGMDNNQIPDDYRSRDYPVKENMRFQLFAWKMQKIGFIALFLFIVSACLGLFSQGWLSNASMTSASGNMVLEYDRFARNATETHYILRIRAAKEKVLKVNLSGDFLDNYDIEYIQPMPDKAFINNKILSLIHTAGDKDGWFSLYITLKPNKMGYFKNSIGFDESAKETLSFNQLVYP